MVREPLVSVVVLPQPALFTALTLVPLAEVPPTELEPPLATLVVLDPPVAVVSLLDAPPEPEPPFTVLTVDDPLVLSEEEPPCDVEVPLAALTPPAVLMPPVAEPPRAGPTLVSV
jgi:hypothetical protein